MWNYYVRTKFYHWEAWTVHQDQWVVNPLFSFQRITISNTSDKNLASHLDLEYELAPYPLILFMKALWEKVKKQLYITFYTKPTIMYNWKQIVDSGFLQHHTKWQVYSSYSDIFDRYLNYVICHYGLHSTVVFDRYVIRNSTKTSEQRREVKFSVGIYFNLLLLEKMWIY